MLRFIFRFFALATSSEQELSRHLLWWLLLRMLLFTLLFIITAFFSGKEPAALLPPLPIALFFLLGIYAFSIVSALILPCSSWSARRFGIVQLFFDILFNAVLVYGTGCSQSDFIALLILPVITGGLILYRLGALFLAAIATLFFGGILVLEQLGWLPGYVPVASHATSAKVLLNANLFAIYGLIFFLAALLSGQLARRLRVTEEKLNQTSLEYDRLSILYKQIFDDISTGILTTDADDRITSCNEAAERITGYTHASILGQPFSLAFPHLCLQEQTGRNVCDYQRKDGTTIRLGYCFSSLNMPSDDQQDASWNRGKVMTLQDISQIEQMEKQVREAEKMAAIGELSASIAHDFRNPLAAISGSAQMLAMEHHPLETLDETTFKTLIGIIVRESNRMAKTITDFLHFARPMAIHSEWFNLNRLVDEVITRLRTTPPLIATDRIRKEMDTHLACWADRQQMYTMLGHLLENACHAMESVAGDIVIAAYEHDSGILRLEIRDEGPGIPPELRGKVLTPFFSSRPDGSGLGLAIVHQIVENHQGAMEIADNQPQGCIIRLEIPQPAIP